MRDIARDRVGDRGSASAVMWCAPGELLSLVDHAAVSESLRFHRAHGDKYLLLAVHRGANNLHQSQKFPSSGSVCVLVSFEESCSGADQAQAMFEAYALLALLYDGEARGGGAPVSGRNEGVPFGYAVRDAAKALAHKVFPSWWRGLGLQGWDTSRVLLRPRHARSFSVKQE